jgi:eukaryotic-like serine/threonine-protein kinase
MAVTKLEDLVLGNRYRLLHQVGKGGMADVFEAYDQMLERPVAIKLLKQNFSTDESFRERFRQEAKSAANLTHPNIVTVYDFGLDPRGIYIVLEFVAGKDLKSRIKERKVFSLQEGIPLVIQACNGLGYAHRAGIVHCDVKPHNLIISLDNRLKITDFGIARALSTLDKEEKSSVVWGSPQYLAPEQSLGAPPSPASDVYSLGIVMYEMFTGQLPFDAPTTDEIIRLHQTQDPTPPSQLNPDCPPELEQIILKVLSKEPSARYRTADQLGRLLSSFFDRLTPVTEPREMARNRSEIKDSPPPITQEDYNSPTQVDSTDWKLIGIELLALLFVGGLIPFWLYVWFSIRPLLR